jgi:hypothetical protein
MAATNSLAKSDVVGLFEQDRYAFAELEDQARSDGLRELDFDEINCGATQAAGFDAGLGHAREYRGSSTER